MQGLKIITLSGEAVSDEEIVAAHRVANTHKEQKIGVIEITDPINDIVVRYHAYNKTAFTSGDVGAYFGYNESVDMRCWCRGVVLAETSPSLPNQRSAVFLTDGTELGSVPRDNSMENSEAQTNNLTVITYRVPPNSTTFRHDIFPKYYSGGNEIEYMQLFYPSNNPSILSIPITVPDDICYTKRNAPTDYDGLFGSGWQTYKDNWNAAQTVALTREHARRKKCSDGQLAYLRNGFMSPEFEYFIKTQHPVSALVRRDIPMEVVSRSQTLDYDVTDSNNNRTRIWTAKVKIKYDVTDDNGVTTPHEKEFTGTVKQEDIEHYDTDMQIVSSAGTPIYTYTNLPMLVNGNTGKAYPLPSPLPSLPYNSSLKLKTTNAFWHDDKSYPLLVEINGTFYNSKWCADNTYGTPAYYHEFTALIPPVQKTTDNLTFTHPQFLLDYIAASKPIEKELDIDGNKVPVTPSTDWLSSRLAHNEVVTIIPLSFVNTDGTDRGMYPYSRTDEVPAQVKLVGFAKVKYNYYTGSFTFVSWTEFTTQGNIKHDGNASYDAETNPTSVNIGGTTYTLQPKYFNYNSAWDTPNCVCIAGKTPWTDTKADYSTQKSHMADIPPEGYTLTAEEILYNEVRKAIK